MLNSLNITKSNIVALLKYFLNRLSSRLAKVMVLQYCILIRDIGLSPMIGLVTHQSLSAQEVK